MKILIAGAGIGGCAVGWALLRQGFEVELFEKNPKIAEVGAGLSLWSNATRALRRMELGHIVDRLRGPAIDGGLFTCRGEVLGHSSVARLDARYGDPNIIVHRADLLDGLLEAVGPERVRVGAPCVGLSQTEDQVRLELEGGETVTGDLLIGADGIHSTVRKALGLPHQPRYSGYTAWRGITSLADCGLDPGAGFWGFYFGEGRQVGLSALSAGRIYWFVTQNTAAGGSAGPSGHRAELLELLSHYPEPVTRVLQATPAEAILRNDIIDLKPITRWSDRRVVLLGDAAHATTPNLGQGACMALEDALVLAHCLGQQRGDPLAALSRYQAIRVKRANRVVQRSWWLGWLLQLERPSLCWLRDHLILKQPLERSVEQLAWLLDEPFALDSPG